MIKKEYLVTFLKHNTKLLSNVIKRCKTNKLICRISQKLKTVWGKAVKESYYELWQ